MIKSLKLIFAFFLLACLLNMPYGFYILVRFLALIIFLIFAYDYYQKEKTSLAIIFCALALLFQPIIKFALGREIWNVVDVVVAILLLFLFVKEK